MENTQYMNNSNFWLKYEPEGKFNLLGRVYSLIFENTCAVLGKFCNEQDYQILYKEKANG